jgi:hypothetical protein
MSYVSYITFSCNRLWFVMFNYTFHRLNSVNTAEAIIILRVSIIKKFLFLVILLSH